MKLIKIFDTFTSFLDTTLSNVMFDKGTCKSSKNIFPPCSPPDDHEKDPMFELRPRPEKMMYSYGKACNVKILFQHPNHFF